MTLEVRNISASISGIPILRNIDFSVPQDGLTGLIGPNGAGKSTLFSVISGFLAQKDGSIALGGRTLDGKGAAERAKAGMVRTFQVPREFRHLTVRENLHAAAPDQPGEHLINLLIRKSRVAEREREVGEQAEAVLRFLKLRKVADTPAWQLSGGQKKLLELGRVMMLKPKIILLDEPFAGVNAVLIEEIMDRIRELHRQGVGFLIIEHDLEALSDLVYEMHVLDNGTLLASGAPHAVLSDSRVREAYLGGFVQ
jgi:branched-chain amino acid transport system ATP-binding protein